MSVLLDESLIQKTIGKLRTITPKDTEAGVLADALANALPAPARSNPTVEEFDRLLRELREYHDSVAPADRQPLSDYATSRVGIYEEDEAR